MSAFGLFWDFISTGDNWSGRTGIGHRLLEHIGFTTSALLLAALVALPLGAVIGHSRRGADFAILLAGAGRVVPAFGVIAYLVLKMDNSDASVIVVLALIAVPSMLSAAYGGVRRVSRPVVESARATGMQPHQVLLNVEVPAAMPSIVSGVRAAGLQVVAATTLAAFVGTGGLGRLIVDGLNEGRYGPMATGAVLVAAVAVTLDLSLAAGERALVSPGLTGRYPVGPRPRPGAVPVPAAEPDVPEPGPRSSGAHPSGADASRPA